MSRATHEAATPIRCVSSQSSPARKQPRSCIFLSTGCIHSFQIYRLSHEFTNENVFVTITYIALFADIVATLFIFDLLLRTPATAGEGHTTGLPTANCNRGAIEIVIAIPILGPIDATALQPILLYPVNQILLIGILTIVLYECS